MDLFQTSGSFKEENAPLKDENLLSLTLCHRLRFQTEMQQSFANGNTIGINVASSKAPI
jgi:hypothetical protein